MKTYPVQHISVTIPRPFEEVYAFTSDLRHLPRWASGLDSTLKVRFVERNHLRVLRNGDGCEVVFTLYRLPQMSDEDWLRDAKAVTRDLRTLRSVLQSG
jgi:hypothetical protein